MFGPVNYLTLGVVTVVHFIFGALWFGVLFGKKWQELVDVTEEKMAVMKSRMSLSFIFSFVGSLLLVYAASRMILLADPAGLPDAILLAILCWSGFSLIKSLQVVAYEAQPWMLFVIDTVYYLLGFLLVFIILFYWR